VQTTGREPGFDVHAHWFGRDMATPDVPDDPRWPRLVVDSRDTGRLLLGSRHYRDVRSSLWDLEQRVADLDAAGIGTQVISPVPVTFPYWASRGPAVAYAEAANASIAAAVAAGRGRLAGIGAVPLPHVPDAIRVLERLMAGPTPFLGVEIGARINGWELDDPRLFPFFEAAESLGAALLVHPVDGGGGTVRRSGQPYDFGLGMLTDTSLAAGALIFGGVLDRWPTLRVVLAHGCGTFPWAYPRMRLAAGMFMQADIARLDELVASLFVDTLVLEPEHLRLLVHRFGPDRLVLGTDHPFFPSTTDDAWDFVREAESIGALPANGAAQVFSANGRTWAASGPAAALA
jgi:aminocarboxymuconate-semialdehyde decarboxylase